MIVYIPTPITSVEQAEALPVGTVGLPNPADDCRAPYLKTEDGWISGWYPDWRRDREQDVEPDAGMVGETALVPVEAEEEWAAEFESGEMCVNLDEETARAADGATAMTRLGTPWEPVADPDRRGDCA